LHAAELLDLTELVAEVYEGEAVTIERLFGEGPDFSAGVAKWPVSPISKGGEYPACRSQQETGAFSPKNKTPGRAAKYPPILPLSAEWRMFSHFVRKEWRWMQSAANSSQRRIPWYQGFCREMPGSGSRAEPQITQKIWEFRDKRVFLGREFK
jgi:hypothetical protein